MTNRVTPDENQRIAPLRILRTDRGELARQVQMLGLRGKMENLEVRQTVEAIVSDVRQRGDEAVCDLGARLDRVRLTPAELRVSELEIGQALEQISLDLISTLRRAADNIRAFHAEQTSPEVFLPTAHGGRAELRTRPLDTVGVYVPGGTAPLPSSVLMNVLPARVAGVRRVVLCTPPGPDGRVAPVILAAAAIAGVDDVYRIGGAQAVAAMAYGTATVPAVDKIVGPGSIWVNTAKRIVFGQVAIDLFAGPSEILIIADETANPEFLAADLLSQAEHDVLASALLLTTSLPLAQTVARRAAERAEQLPRQAILRRSLADFAAILVVPDLATAVEFANELAPEHLELQVADPEALLPQLRNAGAIFIGPYSPEPLGDYFAGPNHVLPTSGTARFSSPLGTADFIKRTSVIDYRRQDLERCAEDIIRFAEAEQLRAHADAIRVRLAERGGDQ